MKTIKLCESEVIETSSVMELPGGNVTVNEREIHEFYRPEPTETRLIIDDAIERTMEFISKTRAEFEELNSVMRELTAR